MIHNDPGHGFVVEHPDRCDGKRRQTVAADYGNVMRLTVTGMQGAPTYTPSEAREVAIALVQWADEKEGLA